jgi:hypothetical protein
MYYKRGHAELGEMGEEWTANKLRGMGHDTKRTGSSETYDVIVNGRMRVEVKSALLTTGNGGHRWQYSLRRNGLPFTEDLLVLLCYPDMESDPIHSFVITGSQVDEMLTKIDITHADPAMYTGRWAKYLDDWDNVERVLPHCVPVTGQEIPF